MLRFAPLVCALGGTLSATVGAPLLAEPITRHFSGVLTNVPFAGPVPIEVGDPISGYVTWDSSTLVVDSSSDNAAQYLIRGAISPNAIHLLIGDLELTAFDDAYFWVGLADNYRESPNAPTFDAIIFGMELEDSNQIEIAYVGLTFASVENLTLLSNTNLSSATQIDSFGEGWLQLGLGPDIVMSQPIFGPIQLQAVPEPCSAVVFLLGSVIAMVGPWIRSGCHRWGPQS